MEPGCPLHSLIGRSCPSSLGTDALEKRCGPRAIRSTGSLLVLHVCNLESDVVTEDVEPQAKPLPQGSYRSPARLAPSPGVTPPRGLFSCEGRIRQQFG